MNARQKAKRYKRMYEELMNQPVKFTVEQCKIDRLRFNRKYPAYLVMQENINDEYFLQCLVKDIANSLSESLGKYVDYRTEFCPHTNEYSFVGEIKVVNREGEQ